MMIASFLIGACLASFVTVLAQPMTSLWRRSVCDGCGRPLKWFQMIPVLSSWLLRNRCHHCNHRPSLLYGFVETLTGLMFVLTASVLPLGWPLLITDIFIVIGLHISLWDWRWRQIPINDLALLGGLTILHLMMKGRFPVSSLIMAGLLFFLCVIWRVRGRPFPLASGDWVLLVITAAWLQPETLPAFLSILGGLGLLSAILYQKHYSTPFFPFAPAILLATWICLVF
ncbi:prepilin peptidase [Candidatus Finniella inopinata]|nr:A24 family peptidase [Candidatus Finniella inopinata]